MSDRAVRVMRALVGVLGAVLVVLSLWVVVARFRYPIDGEWMTGAIRDGVERVRDGKQLYAAPSARFIPFLYTPLYFWVSGFLAHFCSTFVACKLVSITATFAAACGIYRIARDLGATTYWSRVALLLHVATYSLTTLFYDIERVDALFAAMVVVGLALLFARDSVPSMIAAGAILGLAFFAKQAGLVAFAAAVVGLLLAGERRRAALVGISGALLLVTIGAYVESRSGGWFSFYCLKLPRSHGIRAEQISTFFILDMPKAFAIAAGSLAVCVPVLWSFVRARVKPAGVSWRIVVFATSIAAGMMAAFFFRAHPGGWPNVLVTWLPLGCAATALAATQAEERARGTSAEAGTSLALLGGVALQLLGAMFDPMDLSPNAEDMREREQFVALVRKLEVEGEVIVTITGNIAKETSVHAAALSDVLRAGHRAPRDLLEGLDQRRYAAVVIGRLDEYDCPLATCIELSGAILRNYFVAGRRHDREHSGMTGFDARPRWVLRPRRTPLGAGATTKDLLDRQRLELGFAEMKSAHWPMDQEIEPSDEIEELATRELSAHAAR